MKKVLLTSLSLLFGIALVACSGKKTTTKETEKITTKIVTTKNTTTANSTTESKKQKYYTKEGNNIYFGTYPQVLVSDSAKISELNANTSSWTSYNYYVDGSKVDYMYYKDIDTNNDGKNDYRGVYFTSYRPYLTSDVSAAGASYQDENGFEISEIYWFEYKPIKWDILREDSEDILVVADLLLDAQEYYHEVQNGLFDHNDGNGYANNYALSDIRKWLNDSFYNLAFNQNEVTNIKTRSVYNGTTPSKYSCDNTNDNVFLLSKDEAKTYINTDEARRAIGSDYAKIQGLKVNTSIVNTGFSEWGTRTPSANSDYNTTIIYTDGSIDANGINVNNSSLGIRPAILLYA